MVGVAQLVERQVVALVVAGSSPVSHPFSLPPRDLGRHFISDASHCIARLCVCNSPLRSLSLDMSEVYIGQNELGELLRRFDVPVELECQPDQIRVTASYRLLGEKGFRAVLRFQKIRDASIIFNIIDTQPSFWVMDSLIKRTVFHWLQKSGYISDGELNMLEIQYPFFTVDGGKVPAVRQMLEYLTVDGIDFESGGIRLRFHVRPAGEREPVEQEQV